MTGDDSSIEGLSRLDMSPRRAQQIEREALAVLAAERGQLGRPVLVFWTRLLEPSLATGAVAVYLTWLVEVLRPLLAFR